MCVRWGVVEKEEISAGTGGCSCERAGPCKRCEGGARRSPFHALTHTHATTQLQQHNNYNHNPKQEYDAAADVWSPKAPLPEARFRFDAAHVNNMVFVLGGQPTCTNAPGDAEALGRQACGQVALDSVWGYYDAPTPSVYVWTKPAA